MVETPQSVYPPTDVRKSALLNRLTLDRSSLLGRAILLLFSAVLLSGLLSAGIYFLIAQRVYANMRAAELIPIARTVAEIMALSWNDDGTYRQGPEPLLRDANRNFGASLFIYDAQGNQVAVSDNPPPDRGPGGPIPLGPDAPLGGATISAAEAAELISPDLSTILTGNEVSEIERTNTGEAYLVVGVPIETGGAVVFAKSMSELNENVRGLNTALIASTLISFALMLIPAYFLVRRMVVPIRQMNDVATAMSLGNFDVRADESVPGEIGELGASINHFAVESERLQQIRQDYVANVSHELRTPIASIRAMGETLRDGMAKTPEKRQLFYNNIVRESMRLSRLVDDLLELSRLQSGSEAMTKQVFDLREVLQDIADGYGHLAEDADLNFEVTADLAQPIPVNSNADRVEQVLVALMDNAIKHTPENGTITLSCQPSGSKLIVGVANTGAPIPAEDVPLIFERFYTVDKAHTGAGTGLGLSIAREIVDGLDESIWVESDHKSTRFLFTVAHAE